MSLPEGYSKRLIGPNLFFSQTGTVLDIPQKDDQHKLVALWEKEVERLLPHLGWEEIRTAHKIYNNGIRLALVAPVDITLASCDVIDFTWASVRQFVEKGSYKTVDEAVSKLMPTIKAEENLKYRKLYGEATERGFNVFFDSGKVTIGSGKFAFQAELRSLDINAIDWTKIKDIPIVLVTGTNGKTTTVRMTSYICQFSGKVVGYCSTDWVMIDGKIIDRGDFSGPSGNRYVLTNPQVDVAVLEVARGGLCTRGLANTHVSAATISNVSVDHLGQDGVETLEDLCEAKSIVYSAVEHSGHAIVNLDDDHIRERYQKGLIKGKKVFFSQQLPEAEMSEYLIEAHYVCYVEKGCFVLKTNEKKYEIAEVEQVPVTVRGFAKHNIENALNAIALSYELGCSPEQIGKALLTYKNNDEENLGRANVYNVKGATVIVDFAHNSAGLKAMFDMSKAYLPKRITVMWGQTGDRLAMIDEMCRITASYSPQEIIINEIENYLRGAELGQVPKLIEEGLIKYGIQSNDISHVEDELKGVDLALNRLKEGDVCILCVHEEVEEVVKKVKHFSQPVH